jgi:hypothetical protein
MSCYKNKEGLAIWNSCGDDVERFKKELEEKNVDPDLL